MPAAAHGGQAAGRGAAADGGAAVAEAAAADAAMDPRFTLTIDTKRLTVANGDFYVAYKAFCRLCRTVNHSTATCPQRAARVPAAPAFLPPRQPPGLRGAWPPLPAGGMLPPPPPAGGPRPPPPPLPAPAQQRPDAAEPPARRPRLG